MNERRLISKIGNRIRDIGLRWQKLHLSPEAPAVSAAQQSCGMTRFDQNSGDENSQRSFAAAPESQVPYADYGAGQMPLL